jgi:hypothetical protein
MQCSAGIKWPLVTSLGVIALPIHAVWPSPDPPHPARVSPGVGGHEKGPLVAGVQVPVFGQLEVKASDVTPGCRSRRSQARARLLLDERADGLVH